MELTDTFKRRRSANYFRNDEISQDVFLALLEATRFAHSIGNRQLLRFVLVKDRAKVAEISSFVNPSSPGSLMALEKGEDKGPSAFVAMTAPISLGAVIYADAGAAYQNLALQAVEFGLSSAWLRYYDEAAVKSSLEIGADQQLIALVAVGEARGHQSVDHVDSGDTLWPNTDEDYNCSVPKLKGKYLVRWY